MADLAELEQLARQLGARASGSTPVSEVSLRYRAADDGRVYEAATAAELVDRCVCAASSCTAADLARCGFLVLA